MALTNKLTAIADAIRAKTGGSAALSLDDMVTEIGSISGGSEPVIKSKSITANGTYTAPSGVDGYSPIVVNVPSSGGPSAEDLAFTGDISYLNYNGKLDWLFQKYSNQITFSDTLNIAYAFFYTTINDLSNFMFNFDNSGNGNSLEYCFYGSSIKLPFDIASNSKISNMKGTFNNCFYIRNVDTFLNKLDLSGINNQTSVSLIQYTFSNCFSLRTISSTFLSHFYQSGNGVNCNYGGAFLVVPSLDSIESLACWNPSTTLSTRNIFQSAFGYCTRLKNLTFLTENNAPLTRSWKSQVINLVTGIGYVASNTYKSYILNYNSGITADKEVTDAASYAALKNDPDWFTCNVAYSRYNHDSAVATINSLPDTSAYIATAGGTNTIRFQGNSGSATDGGAINTLTAAEIAVATNKGWTVTLN